MILGFIGGQLLDAKFGTRPILAVLGFLMGAASGFWGVWRLAMRDFIKDDRRKRARRTSRHSEIARDRNREGGQQ
ncbi:MAG TPA: AtpZ/AtpI family protein [Firmicutes bacterium]|nr:AtpZ/AtpI family protein [Bacillota bacterium]HHY98403.1 AtpZ/AtpI family protein [Bacillota bacterium]